jgi:hypothetical protein
MSDTKDALPSLGTLASPEAKERTAKAIEAARERARQPAPPIDPNLPKEETQ